MTRALRADVGVTCALLAAALGLGAPRPSAADEPAPARCVYVDEDYAFRLTPLAGWQRGNPARVSVPGEVCRVWTSNGQTSITVFVQKPGTALHPKTLLAASVLGIEKLGATVEEQEVKSVAGLQAMWLRIEGAGTGGALTGKGTVPTGQLWVAVPRESDILVLLLTAPADGWTIAEAAFKAMLDTLELGGRQTAEQRQPEPPAPAPAASPAAPPPAAEAPKPPG